MNQDDEHLNLLSVFHYVLAGLTGLFALFPMIYVIIGLVFVFGADRFEPVPPQPADLDPFAQEPFDMPQDAQIGRWVGWLFIGLGAAAVTIGLTFAGLLAATGRFLAKRKNHTFCMVIAAIECLFFPLGTVLGVFTIIVLMRDSVKQRFAITAQ